MDESFIASKVFECLAAVPGAKEQLDALVASEANFEFVSLCLARLERPEARFYLLQTIGKVISARPSSEGTVGSIRGRSNQVGEAGRVEGSSLAYRALGLLTEFVQKFNGTAPAFLINAACDSFGSIFKTLLMSKGSMRPVFALLAPFSPSEPSPQDLHSLLKFLHYTLSNLTHTTSQGYFEYRKLLTRFENEGLPFCLEAVRVGVKRAADSPVRVDLIVLALEVLLQLLTFPFGLSYFEFCQEVASEELCLVLFPDSYHWLITDQELRNILVSLAVSKISKEVSLGVIRVLQRIASCRISLFQNEQSKTTHKNSLISSFGLLIDSSPLEDRVFVQELVELGLRTIYVLTSKFISSIPDNYSAWLQGWEKLGAQVLLGCTGIIDQVFEQYLIYLKGLAESDAERAWSAQTGFLSAYLRKYFTDPPRTSFFPESLLGLRKFAVVCENHFGPMRKLFFSNPRVSERALEDVMNQLARQETLLLATRDPNLFASRLAHFALIVACWSLKNGYESYSYLEEDLSETSTRGSSSAFLFSLVSKLHTYESILRKEVRVVLEMSILHFFERFLHCLKPSHSSEFGSSEIHVTGEFWTAILKLNLFESYEKFFSLLVDKLLSNLKLSNKQVSLYSIQVLKASVDKTKKLTETAQQQKLFHALAEKLFEAAGEHLTSPHLLKTRSELMKLLSLIFLDDICEDYISNAKMLLARLSVLNAQPQGINMIGFLNDVRGIMDAISSKKIIVTFVRVFYPEIRKLLQEQSSNVMTDKTMVYVVLDLFACLLEQISQVSFGNVQEVTLHVIADCCAIMKILISKLNSSLSGTSEEARVDFLEQHLKLAKKFLRVFCQLLKNSSLSFSVFHAFGDSTYAEFVNQTLLFASLIAKPLFERFPQKREELVSFLNEVSSTITQMISHSLSCQSFSMYLEALLFYFTSTVEAVIFNPESKKIGDDSLISNVQSILSSIFIEVYEVEKIYPEDDPKVQNVQNIMANTATLMTEFLLKMIDYILNLSLNFHSRNLLADILFFSLIGYRKHNLFNRLETAIILLYPHIRSEQLSKCVDHLRISTVISLKPQVREDFQIKFVDFLSELRQTHGLAKDI